MGFYAKYGQVLSIATVNVCVSVCPFIKDSLRWTDQLKICPAWIWKATRVLGVYILGVACVLILFAGDVGALLESCILMGLDAIALFIIYSTLYAGYLEGSELVRRAGGSLAMAAFIVVTLLAYHAGYLHHSQSY